MLFYHVVVEIVNVYADSQELPSFSFVGGKNVDFRIDINNTLHLKYVFLKLHVAVSLS